MRLADHSLKMFCHERKRKERTGHTGFRKDDGVLKLEIVCF